MKTFSLIFAIIFLILTIISVIAGVIQMENHSFYIAGITAFMGLVMFYDYLPEGRAE